MEDSRIYLLLEEIANEIKSIEKKNRELYTSAIDVEDESVSIKVQAESFATLRRMRGLKSAMEVFKSELEKSGILKGSSGVYISNEHGSIGFGDTKKTQPEAVSEPAPKINTYEEFEYTPEAKPATPPGDLIENPVNFYELNAEPDFNPDFNSDFNDEESEPLPDYIAAEIENVGDIINELNKSMDEGNDDGISDDDFADLVKVSLDSLEFEPEFEFGVQKEQEQEPKTQAQVFPQIQPDAEATREAVNITEDSIESLEAVIDTVEGALEAIEEDNQNEVENSIEAALGQLGEFGPRELPREEKPPVTPPTFEPVSTPQPRPDVIPIIPEPQAAAPTFEPVSTPQPPVTPPTFEPVSTPQPRPETIPVIPEPTIPEFNVPEFSTPEFSEPAFSPPEVQIPEIPALDDISKLTDNATGVSEAEDDDFSGFTVSVPEVGIYNNRVPAGFVMFGRRVEVRDWSDMLVKVCEILILKNPYTVAQFDKYHDLNPSGNIYFSYNRTDIKDSPRKLSNGLWIELTRTNDDVVMLCKKLLELCGYPRSDIEIEFKD
ncbi:MAG: hypothetical protein FWF94_02805 [Oscillospiraceae bacterium]|nr:hypothetical protein [Oscillospiraceae bacterium]